MDHQSQLVDEFVLDQHLHELARAGDENNAVDLLLELSHFIGRVPAQRGGLDRHLSSYERSQLPHSSADRAAAATRLPALRPGHRRGAAGGGLRRHPPTARQRVSVVGAGGDHRLRARSSWPASASRRWPRRSTSSSGWATSSAAQPQRRRSRLVFLTERGAAVKPVTHATAERVERRWAELTSPEELEALRASLLRFLTEVRGE